MDGYIEIQEHRLLQVEYATYKKETNSRIEELKFQPAFVGRQVGQPQTDDFWGKERTVYFEHFTRSTIAVRPNRGSSASTCNYPGARPRA